MMAKSKISARQQGMRMPQDLVLALNEEATIAIMGTFSEIGLPRTTPIHFMLPKEPDSIIIALDKECLGYQNLVWQKKVSLCVLEEGNIAYSLLCRAGVIKAPSEVHPLMNIIRLDVIEIHKVSSPVFNIETGIRCAYTCFDAKDLSIALRDELRKITQTL